MKKQSQKFDHDEQKLFKKSEMERVQMTPQLSSVKIPVLKTENNVSAVKEADEGPKEKRGLSR